LRVKIITSKVVNIGFDNIQIIINIL